MRPTNVAPGENERQADGSVIQGASLVLGSILSVVSVVAFAPILPQLMVAFQDVPHAEFWVPALVGVAGLGAAVFAPFAGFIGDRFGRRVPLIWFCLAYAIFGLSAIFTDDFELIFLTRILVGITFMGVLILSTAMIGDYFSGARLDRWIAIQAMIATLSALVFLPIGGFLGAWLGWRGPFLISVLGLPLAFSYWFFFGNRAAGSGTARTSAGWSALPWRWLIGVSFISAFSALFFFAVQLQIGLALAVLGITDASRIGLLSAIAVAGIPVGALAFIKVAAYPFGKLLRLEFLGAGAALMAMNYTDDYLVFILLAFVNLVSCGMMLPTLLTHVSQRLGGPVRARGIGIWQAFISSGQFLCLGVTALVLRYPGATVLDSFWVLGVSGVAAAILAWIFALVRRNPGPVALRAN